MYVALLVFDNVDVYVAVCCIFKLVESDISQPLWFVMIIEDKSNCVTVAANREALSCRYVNIVPPL